MKPCETPVYTFSDKELKALALFFRQHAAIPEDLYALSVFAERYVYQVMTIAEAEHFYASATG